MQIDIRFLVFVAVLLTALLVTVGFLLWQLLRRDNSAQRAAKIDIAEFDATLQAHMGSALSAFRNEVTLERQQSLRENQTQLELIAKSQHQAVMAELDKDKQLIDQRLTSVGSANSESLKALAGQIHGRFKEMSEAIQSLQTKSAEQFGNVNTALQNQQQSTETLSQITQELDKVLGSSSRRGALGEHLVEQILETAGMVAGVHYDKQVQIPGSASRPDFIFYLPGSQTVYMDVKFPFAAYVRLQEASDVQERELYSKEFANAVKTHIDKLAKRDYATKGGPDVLDQVIMFLPNESVAGFVFETDRDLIDLALEKQIVMCSPMTLFAYLGVIRQATDRFILESASRDILEHLGEFESEFAKYCQQVDRVKKQFSTVSNSFEILATTRRNTLEKPLKRIRDLREQSLGTSASAKTVNFESGDEIVSERRKVDELTSDIDNTFAFSNAVLE